MLSSHARAAWAMVAVSAMWATAGVLTRRLETAQSFEITFWRSAFTAVFVSLIVWWLQGPGIVRRLLQAPRALWLSGACWGVMFTAFMMALTLATVAEVLITMAISPLLTALLARIFLRQKIHRHTWGAIAVAAVGMVWMFAQPRVTQGVPWGSVIALLVPASGATNWCLLQHRQAQHDAIDMMPAVLIGACLSSLVTLPLALPFAANLHDMAVLSLLGLVQLAIPCTLLVACAKVLPAPEISLLSLLEVLFGIAFAWAWANETPKLQVLCGGTLVLLALLANAWQNWRLTQGKSA